MCGEVIPFRSRSIPSKLFLASLKGSFFPISLFIYAVSFNLAREFTFAVFTQIFQQINHKYKFPILQKI